MSRDVTLGTGEQGEAARNAAENSRRAEAELKLVTCSGGCGFQRKLTTKAITFRCDVCRKAAAVAAREGRSA